jgi:Flp pilus assembly protein TadD
MSGIAQTLRAGLQLHRSGELARAEQVYRQALAAEPENANAWCLLGAVCLALGRTTEAVENFQRAVRLQPGYVEAHSNLGVALTELGRLTEAAESLREALRLRPDYAEGLNNLGSVLRDLNELEPAIGCFRDALRLKPDYAEAHNNLGVALTDFGQPEEAVGSLSAAIRLKPDYATAHMSLGNALRDQGSLEAALAHYAEALRLAPGYAEAHFNRSLILLIQGKYAEAWPEYDWRWRCKGFPKLPFREPAWDGAPLEGRTILVHAEQGLGDAIQFLRFVPMVKERGGNVILRCPPALAGLAERTPGVGRVVSGDQPLPRFETHIPLMSLARVFGATLEDLRADVPYLFPDPNLVGRWKQALAGFGGMKVGVAWQGNPKFAGDRRRSFPLGQVEPVAQIEGVHLFSLQKGFGAEQLEALGGRFRVEDLTARAEDLH